MLLQKNYKLNHDYKKYIVIKIHNYFHDSNKLSTNRFKLITEVMIGEKKQQGIVTASRFLWDETRDNYASVKYENQSLFAVAVIYALNFE